jgi:tetratricopeptide (TPR) repeat protein
MNRRNLMLVAFAASIIAGMALLRARNLKSGAPDPACAENASCGSAAVPPSSDVAPPSAPPPFEPDSIAPKAPQPVPENGSALRDEADRLIADGKVLEGLEVFRRAVAADPTAKNHGDLGSLLYRLTAFDEAATHLRAAAELDPANADRWIALANAYYRKVDLGEAWKAEQRAREAEPGLELARDGSGMRIRKGDKAPRYP